MYERIPEKSVCCSQPPTLWPPKVQTLKDLHFSKLLKRCLMHSLCSDCGYTFSIAFFTHGIPIALCKALINHSHSPHNWKHQIISINCRCSSKHSLLLTFQVTRVKTSSRSATHNKSGCASSKSKKKPLNGRSHLQQPLHESSNNTPGLHKFLLPVHPKSNSN